ncbi:MAG: PilZ domain-containing protein [Candidatus Omnitrophica bacterium]|nr:PilZ domain-containing protein [Candidatus Omnitrophota bacterium]
MITTSPPGFERRLFERFIIRFPTKFKDSRDDFGSNVFLHEASASGLRITTKERLFVNDVVVLEIEVPDQAPPLNLKGEVVWVKSIEPYGWESGLKFPKLNLLRLERLYKFIADR